MRLLFSIQVPLSMLSFFYKDKGILKMYITNGNNQLKILKQTSRKKQNTYK